MSDQEESPSAALNLLVNAISDSKDGSHPVGPLPKNGTNQGGSGPARPTASAPNEVDSQFDQLQGELGDEAFGEQDMINLSGLLGHGDFDTQDVPIQDQSSMPAEPGQKATSSKTPLLPTIDDAETRLVLAKLMKKENRKGLISNFEVWHPTAAQKSYGKERRLLTPPPILRSSGPLIPLITSMSLSVMPESSTTPVHSTQAHTFSPSIDSSASPSSLNPTKKARREEKKKQFRLAAQKSGFGATLPHSRSDGNSKSKNDLSEGLAFAGLWVGGDAAPSGKGIKEKEVGFRISLNIKVNQEMDLDPTLMGSTELQSDSTNLLNLASSPLSIVSKPSQKTSKARSISSCLPQSASFSLYVRIHGQTVRTKYLKMERSQASDPVLSSKTGSWTPFKFEIIRHASSPNLKVDMRSLTVDTAHPKFDIGTGMLTYGSIVRLVDVGSGVKSEECKLVRIDKNESWVNGDEGDPVCDLQRVGLVRLRNGAELRNEEGGRSYLSAPGARMGGGELRQGEVGQPGRKRKNPPRALKGEMARKEEAEEGGGVEILMNDNQVIDPGLLDDFDEETAVKLVEQINTVNEPEDSIEGYSSLFALPDMDIGNNHNQNDETAVGQPTGSAHPEEMPRKRLKTKRNALAAAVLAENEEGQSKVKWITSERIIEEREIKEGKVTVKKEVVIEKVDDWMCWVIAGVDRFSASFNQISSTTHPISPIPRLLLDPDLNSSTNELHLTVSSFFSPLPDAYSHLKRFEIYLGNIGPLAVSTYRSTFTKDPLKDPPTPVVMFDGQVTSGDVDEVLEHGERRIMSNFQSKIEHVLLFVKLPSTELLSRHLNNGSDEGNTTLEPSETERIGVAGDDLASQDIPQEEDGGDSQLNNDDLNWFNQNHSSGSETLNLDQVESEATEAIRQALQRVTEADQDLIGRKDDEAISQEVHADLQEAQSGKIDVGVNEGNMLENAVRGEESDDVILDQQAEKHRETLDSATGRSLPIFCVKREGGVIFSLGWSIGVHTLPNEHHQVLTLQRDTN